MPDMTHLAAPTGEPTTECGLLPAGQMDCDGYTTIKPTTSRHCGYGACPTHTPTPLVGSASSAPMLPITGGHAAADIATAGAIIAIVGGCAIIAATWRRRRPRSAHRA